MPISFAADNTLTVEWSIGGQTPSATTAYFQLLLTPTQITNPSTQCNANLTPNGGILVEDNIGTGSESLGSWNGTASPDQILGNWGYGYYGNEVNVPPTTPGPYRLVLTDNGDNTVSADLWTYEGFTTQEWTHKGGIASVNSGLVSTQYYLNIVDVAKAQNTVELDYVHIVPEPGSLVLLVGGLLGLAVYGCARRT